MPESDVVEEQTGFDMESAVERLGNELFPEAETPDEKPSTAPVAEALVEQTTKESEKVVTTPEKVVNTSEKVVTTPETPITSTAPKSWPKEMHDHWAKTPPEVQQYWQTREKQMLDGLDQYKGAAQYGKTIQDAIAPFQQDIQAQGVDAQYGKTIQDAIAPFQQDIQAQGVDAPRAISFLLEANRRLTTGSVESRRQAYEELGRNLGLPSQAQPGAEPQAPLDPRIQTLEQRIASIQEAQTRQQQAALDAAKAKSQAEVDAFAADPKHAFFDEVHEDIVKFIQAGASLQEAYDRAIWANPVTREKQMQERLSTEAEKAKERARLDALPKKKAQSVNVRSRDTSRTPTEPVGSIEDTMRETLTKIKAR